jgi:hypothetical protein
LIRRAADVTGRVLPEAARLFVIALAACFGLAAAVLAYSVPYHDSDALSYGEWSRLIGRTGGIWFPSITDQTYHLPLFYVLQGWLWWILGFDERYGRALSLAFSIMLVVTLALLGARGRTGRVRWVIVVASCWRSRFLLGRW